MNPALRNITAARIDLLVAASRLYPAMMTELRDGTYRIFCRDHSINLFTPIDPRPSRALAGELRNWQARWHLIDGWVRTIALQTCIDWRWHAKREPERIGEAGRPSGREYP